jgi:hypothetical protein
MTPAVITPAVAGDKVPVGSRVRMRNNTAGAVTFTMTVHQDYDGNLTIPDRVVSVPASATRVFLADGRYRNPTDGYVDILCSATTNVELEVTI